MAGGTVDSRDEFILKVLTSTQALTVDEAKAVTGWWLADRAPDEALLSFLVRQEVFAPTSVATIERLLQGAVPFSDAGNLFTSDGVGRLRRLLDLTASDTETSVRAARPSVPAVPTQRAGSSGIRALEIGTFLGKCLLTEQVGQGATGLVFRALHRTLRIAVAVKVLQFDAAQADSRIHQRFRAEARLLAQLNHPHVVRVLDFEDDSAAPYLVLEYVEGLNLAELIHQSGQVRADRATRIILQVSEGLAAAHQRGILHRDVKPANILLTKDGTAKLADLGLAVVVGAAGATPERMAGTAAYMAPERAVTSPAVDHRADVYSLGCTFYHAVTGQLPFHGRGWREVLLKHAQEQPVPPHRLVPDVDPGLSAIILRMMAKDPAARFPGYPELMAALRAAPSRAAAPAWAAASGTGSGLLSKEGSGGSGGGGQRRSLWRSLFRFNRKSAEVSST
jgi:tRNA A-37 threonylcarbamoyl transferase component Bud32